MNQWVYIASPYTGDEERNTVFQIMVANKLVRLGFIPVWPLASHYWHLQYPHDYEYWMYLDFEYIKRCDALLRMGGKSAGADREVEFAQSLGIPVFYNYTDLVSWKDEKEIS